MEDRESASEKEIPYEWKKECTKKKKFTLPWKHKINERERKLQAVKTYGKKKERWTKWSVVYFSKVESFSCVTLIRVRVSSFFFVHLSLSWPWSEVKKKMKKKWISTKRVYVYVYMYVQHYVQLNRESLHFFMTTKLSISISYGTNLYFFFSLNIFNKLKIIFEKA